MFYKIIIEIYCKTENILYYIILKINNENIQSIFRILYVIMNKEK